MYNSCLHFHKRFFFFWLWAVISKQTYLIIVDIEVNNTFINSILQNINFSFGCNSVNLSNFSIVHFLNLYWRDSYFFINDKLFFFRNKLSYVMYSAVMNDSSACLHTKCSTLAFGIWESEILFDSFSKNSSFLFWNFSSTNIFHIFDLGIRLFF